jgi:thiamine-phosphate pyrophosphorylase
MNLPALYAIVDASCFATAPNPPAALFAHARELAAGGVALIQYRNKNGGAREMLAQARELRSILPPAVKLIMNDRADLCLAAGFDGVHVGQDDLPPEAVRAIVGNQLIVGVSTHNVAQVRAADAWPIDYIAVGPVFATASKANPDPVIGLDGVRAARGLTRRPLVAIGGITRANYREVIEAGADSVAVIADLLGEPRKATQEFLRIV